MSRAQLWQILLLALPLMHVAQGIDGLYSYAFDEVSALQVYASVNSGREWAVGKGPFADSSRSNGSAVEGYPLMSEEEASLEYPHMNEEEARLLDQPDLGTGIEVDWIKPDLYPGNAVITDLNDTQLGNGFDAMSEYSLHGGTATAATEATMNNLVALTDAENSHILTATLAPHQQQQNNTVDKTVVMVITAIPFLNGIGVTRLYMGNPVTAALQMFVGCATCGIGAFIWGQIDAGMLAVNAFNGHDSINSFGMQANFTKSSIEKAWKVGMGVVFETVLIGLCVGYVMFDWMWANWPACHTIRQYCCMPCHCLCPDIPDEASELLALSVADPQSNADQESPAGRLQTYER